MPDQKQWIPLARLGAGSFGHVFLAMSATEASPLFAVKTSASPSSSSARHILLHELEILQSLSSPYIIRCLGSDVETSSIFLEYMDSGSIVDLLHCHGKLSEAQIRFIAGSILRGLAYLHRHGVVHCDIKGRNVLLASNGSVKIADFGSSKRIHGERQLHDLHEQKQIPRGTPLWMAPEVIHGVSQGAASDIWSFGCTVVEMFQGRPPWTSISELANAIALDNTTSPSFSLPNSASPLVKDFLLRCFQTDPEARWSAEQLLLHPFITCTSEHLSEVKLQQLVLFPDQPSPRSILDNNFCDTDSGFNDFESLQFISFVSQPLRDRFDTVAMSKLHSDVVIPQERDWIKVRGLEEFNSISNNNDDMLSQLPFMQSFAGAVVVKGSRNVNLEAAAFLCNRHGSTHMVLG